METPAASVSDARWKSVPLLLFSRFSPPFSPFSPCASAATRSDRWSISGRAQVFFAVILFSDASLRQFW